jgi:predicted hydrocarbon binding protein
VAEDAMSRAISKASELRPQRTPLTLGQQRAWRKLAKEFGDDLATLNINSARDIAEAGIKSQMEEAAELMTHPAVQEAYNKFLLVCEMTRKNSKT